ncbi:MAG: porin [Acidithiobacillus sp.]
MRTKAQNGRYAVTLFAVVASALLSPSAVAANWFELQGISPPKAPLFGVSGFIEPSLYLMNGTAAENRVPPINNIPRINLVAPNNNQSNALTMLRARLMLRGNLNQHISYFLGGEFGNNALTDVRGSYSPALIDGHVTFSYIPGARVEAGIIRAPGPEDAMQGYMAYNYVLFPTAIGQLMQQTFYDSGTAYKAAAAPGNPYLVSGGNTLGTNGFRYPGVQVMDWFRFGHWELAYAAMAGVYGSVAAGNQSSSPLYAARIQGSYIFGGEGPFRSDVTAYLWYQHARPDLNGQSYAMTREGLGFTYLQGYMHQWGRRLKAEYIRGSGWISAPAAFSPASNLAPVLSQTQLYPGSDNKANGFDVEGGLFLTKHIEADVRYDYYDRLPNNPQQERIFKTWALALQYHFTPLTKVMAGYYFRTLSVPYQPNPVANSISNAVDNEVAMQAMISF